MSEDLVSPLLAVMALLALAGSVIVAIGVGSPGAHGLRGLAGSGGRWASFAVAAIATSSSLYYSEVAHFVPCEFCWFQRIAMYPLAVILLVAAITRDRRAARYVVPIAAIGLLLSLYHYQLELFPEQSTFCSTGIPCSFRYVEEFGFISIPFMAGCGFIAILALHLAMYRAQRFASTAD